MHCHHKRLHRYDTYLRWLCFASGCAIDIDRILAWGCEVASFVIEQQTVSAQFLFGHSITTFNVGIALTTHGVPTVWLIALSAEVFRLHSLLLHWAAAQKLLFTSANRSLAISYAWGENKKLEMANRIENS